MIIIFGCYLFFNKNRLNFVHNKFIKISIVIWTITPFILFSLSKSKLVWYINTIYPALTILIAWICYSVFKNIQILNKMKSLILILLILSTLCGEASILHKIKINEMPSSQTELISLGKNNSFKNENIYTEKWPQSNMFIILEFLY